MNFAAHQQAAALLKPNQARSSGLAPGIKPQLAAQPQLQPASSPLTIVNRRQAVGSRRWRFRWSPCAARFTWGQRSASSGRPALVSVSG